MLEGENSSGVFRTRLSRSLLVAGILVLLGTGLRLWGLSHLGLIHFDEGVYAISGFWATVPIQEARLYPKQALYSPPLYVFLVGLSYRAWGEASDQAAILVNVLVGGATIALLWWLTKRWFGPQAGLAAAAFIALSEYHIAFSRVALTDILFGFFFLLCFAWITRTWETASFRWAVLAGLAVGAAWNTKYHGWLPLAVAFLALVAFAATRCLDRSLLKRLLACWMLMCAVAALSYLPWALYVQLQQGGYLALMKYQRSFLSLHWLSNLWRQVEMQWYFDGWLSRLSPAVAYGLALLVREQQQRRDWKRISLVGLLLLCSGFVLGGVGTAIGITLLVMPKMVRRSTYSTWMLLCSLVVLVLSTPLYRPYSRLLVPLVLILYVAAGAGIREIFVDGTLDRAAVESRTGGRRKLSALAVGSGLLVLLSLLVGLRPAPRIWMPSDSVRQAVTSMVDLLPKEGTVFVHGAPEVAFYLLRGDRAAIPIDDPIDHPSVTGYYRAGGSAYFLITGVYSQREPRSRASLGRLANRLRLLGVFPIGPNDVRLLDDFPPKKALQYRLNPSRDYDLRLYQIDASFTREVPQGGELD